MTTPPSKKQLTHERIVATAAQAIRRGGFAGVGVADVMKQAGLTHGGFYAHFPSRDALLREAIEHAGRDSSARIGATAGAREAKGVAPLRAFIERYLSEAHLVATDSGCPVAALAAELPRQSREVMQAGAERVRALIAALERRLPQGVPRSAAGVIAGQLVGTLQLARALGDNAEGKALLAATRRALLAQYDSESKR